MANIYVVNDAATYNGAVPEGYTARSAGDVYLRNSDRVILSNTLTRDVTFRPESGYSQNVRVFEAPIISFESGTHGAYTINTAVNAGRDDLIPTVQVGSGVSAPEVNINLGQTDGARVDVSEGGSIGNITGGTELTDWINIYLGANATTGAITTTGRTVLEVGQNATVNGSILTGARGGLQVAGLDDKITINRGATITGSIETGGGSDILHVHRDVEVQGGIDLGFGTPNDDLLHIHYAPHRKDEFEKALTDQGFELRNSAHHGMRFYAGQNTTFKWDGITYTRVDWLQGLKCFAGGTLIDVGDGQQRPVEDLRKGDYVVSYDRGPQKIRWVGDRKLSSKCLDDNPKLRPIRIRAGALGNGLPLRDLVVSPQHRILIKSAIAERMFDEPEVLVPARQLCQIDGIDIAHDLEEVEYFHILLPQHEIVRAEGALTESLYTGPQARAALGSENYAELITLFPELTFDGTHEAARPLLSGRTARKMVIRHVRNKKSLMT